MNINLTQNTSSKIKQSLQFNAMAGGILEEEHLILIVDDDTDLSALMALPLRDRGFRVLTASSGGLALSMITRHRPDLILLDIMMPGMNGHEVLRRIKQNPQLSATPVVMMTSRTEQKNIVDAMQDGALTYLMKPVNPDVLADKVEDILMPPQGPLDDGDFQIVQILENEYRYGG